MNSKDAIPAKKLASYGALAVAIAFATLPIYMYIPKFYAEFTTLNLAYLGTALLLIRLVDTVQDPLIGLFSDTYSHKRKTIMGWSVPFLAGGYIMLFTPPEHMNELEATLWLTASMLIVYSAYSVLTINYYAQGVGLTKDYHQHSRVAAFREGAMLIGVLLAAILPQGLQQIMDERSAFLTFGILFAIILAITSIPTIRVTSSVKASNGKLLERMKTIFAMNQVRWILILFFFNTVPTAITSTVFLFYVEDVIQAPDWAGASLIVYFLSAAASLPFWLWMSKRYSKRDALTCAMVLVIATFSWAYFLGAGDLIPFLIICVLAGFSVGADLSLLPSLYADQLSSALEHSAAGFGVWNLVNKFNLALAAGIVLPMLYAYGYDPKGENGAHQLAALTIAYAVIPCVFKIVALMVLLVSPIDKKRAALAP